MIALREDGRPALSYDIAQVAAAGQLSLCLFGLVVLRVLDFDKLQAAGCAHDVACSASLSPRGRGRRGSSLPT